VKAYDRLIHAMAWAAGALLALMFAAIVVDVVLRNLGFQSSAHLFTFTEYALLMVPCLGAPWLVREKGHVFVEIGLNLLSATARRRAVVLVGVVCIAVCLVLAWYGFEVTLRNWRLGDKDVRSFDAPRWLLVVCIPVSFLFMATEFLRHLLRGDDFLGSMTAPDASMSTLEASAVAAGAPSPAPAPSDPAAPPARHP
jgi:TRAP-type C4-dicarboxylate transport system permease small subunit